MIAYYGQMRFEALSAGSFDRLIAAHFASPLYGNDWMVANGQGELILGDRGYDINSYDLDDGNLTVRASSLLGFEPTMELKESIVPGYLTLLGTGKFLASSNGPVHFVEPPVRVDPDALLGWADCPTPCHHYDHAYMRGALGMARAMTGIGGAVGRGAPVRLPRRGNGADAVLGEGAVGGRRGNPSDGASGVFGGEGRSVHLTQRFPSSSCREAAAASSLASRSERRQRRSNVVR